MPIDIKRQLQNIEDRLRLDLDDARATFEHAGDKGAKIEKTFRSYLREHLPRNFEVGEGEIIDTAGCVAGAIGPGQIDVIIVDGNHPRTFTPDQPGTFFIEGVLAAGEIKSILTSKDFQAVLDKSAAFKRLAPIVGRTTISASNPSDMARFTRKRAYFLFALESQLTLETMTQRIVEYCTEHGLSNRDVLDAIFCLDRGCLVDFDDGAGSMALLLPDGSRATGWGVFSSGPISGLIGWLSGVMPVMMRFDPIFSLYIFRVIR